MTNEQVALEIIHVFGVICLIASLLIRILPTPDEISSWHYKIAYGIIRRCSLNAPNGGNTNGSAQK